eukprot:2269987-Prymnesium_polylepis.1
MLVWSMPTPTIAYSLMLSYQATRTFPVWCGPAGTPAVDDPPAGVSLVADRARPSSAAPRFLRPWMVMIRAGSPRASPIPRGTAHRAVRLPVS